MVTSLGQVGDSPLLARITRQSITQLDIAADMEVYAQIKSFALME